MDTIAPPLSASIRQIARLIELLEVRGIGRDEIQRLIDQPAVCERVADVMRIDKTPIFDLSGQLYVSAMRRVIEYLFQHNIDVAKHHDGKLWYSPNEGYDPRDLYKSENFRQLLHGLSNLHVAVIVLRSGLLNGKPLSAREAAERLNIEPKAVTRLRAQVNTHIKARQAELFPFLQKREFVQYAYFVNNENILPELTFDDSFLGDAYMKGAHLRLERANIKTMAELRALPLRQIARLFLGDVYLPPELFPEEQA